MRSDRAEALRLRLSGKSYSEIQRILGVPKSTLSSWFSNLVLSEAIRHRLAARTRASAIATLIQRNRAQTVKAQARARSYRKASALRMTPLSEQELFLVGLALYWAEGHKRPVVAQGRERTWHVVSLTNADPILIRLFLRFLRECCAVPNDRIRANLRVFPHQNSNELRLFWLRTTKILPGRLSLLHVKPRPTSGQRPFSRLPYGVIQIRVGDTKLFHTIMGSLEGLGRFA